MPKLVRRIFTRLAPLLLLQSSALLMGQDTLNLDLKQSIEIALDKSFNIRNLKEANRWAERNLWAAKAAYRTNINLNLSAPIYNEGFTLVEVVGGNPVPKQYGDFRVRGLLDINQPMPWLPLGGGTLTFRSEGYQMESWTPSLLDPATDLRSKKFFSSLSVRLTKPLFTINTLALNLKQAELSYERQSRIFKRSELDLIYQISHAFYQLYKEIENYSLIADKVKRQENIYQTTLNKFKAGLIAEVEAMQAEVDLIQYRNELESSEGRLSQMKAAFKQLIGMPIDVPISLQAELEVKPVAIDVEKAVALALQNRSEIVEKQIDIEQQKISVKQIDAQVSIKGNLSGYYDLSGFSDPDLPYSSNTSELFRSSWKVLRDTPNRGVTFELQIPIFDWGRNRAQVQAAQANLRQDELTMENLLLTIEREVRDVVNNVYQAYDRLQMLEKSTEVSKKSFDISLQRFANGDITSTELDRASEKLNTSRLSYLEAYNEYKLALADLRKKTLYDFEENRSLVEDATAEK